SLDEERDRGFPYRIQVEALVEKAKQRPDRARGIVVLGVRKQQRRAALEVAQVDVVAERGADYPSVRGDGKHDLGLGIVPGRFAVDAGVGAGADGGESRRLGENLGVGADAYLQILAPRALSDQYFFELHCLGRSGL